MSELRQRLLEAAEAAAREGQIPSAAVVVSGDAVAGYGWLERPSE
jgi:tRNA(Arg) A34 adenosine deaminase TadA